MTDIHFGSMVAEDDGTGDAVVMIHGLGGTSNSFQTLMPALAGYRVLRLDLPGAGRSDYRPGVPGMAGMVSATKNAVRSAGIECAHFVGHSMGTLVCQYLAAESPNLVSSMTLYGAILEPPPVARDALKERAATAREQGMTPIAEAISTGSVGEASRQRNPVTKAFVRESLMRQNPMSYALHCEALSEAVPANHEKIECSTLLVAGEFDYVAPVAMGEALAARIRNARLVVIDGIGHWLMIEAIDRCSKLLREHLDSLE